jgi:hypothetical protein
VSYAPAELKSTWKLGFLPSSERIRAAALFLESFARQQLDGAAEKG